MNSQNQNLNFPRVRNARGGLTMVLGVVAVFFILLLVVGVLPRMQQNKNLKEMHEQTSGAVPVVHTVVAELASQKESVVLPCNIGAMQYATINARVSGYLSSRLVDIGDRVKTGQLLAVIASPEVDEEVNQATADLAQARASYQSAEANLKQAIATNVASKAAIEKSVADLKYAQVTAQRWETLCEHGSVSKQSRDEKVRANSAAAADLESAKAEEKATAAQVNAAKSQLNVSLSTIKAKQASVARYTAQKSFEKVIAPFEGVITARKVDPGDLITAGSGSQELQLFQMAKMDSLRIYVQVPQRIARYLGAGDTADISVPEFPGQTFVGKITNISGALDPNSRTLQTEIHMVNPGLLLPGMYANVTINTVRAAQWIQVPGTTLVTRPDGSYLVVVHDSKVHYQAVDVGRDFGQEIEIKTGIKAGEVIVVSPDDDLRDNEQVQAIATTAEQ